MKWLAKAAPSCHSLVMKETLEALSFTVLDQTGARTCTHPGSSPDCKHNTCLLHIQAFVKVNFWSSRVLENMFREDRRKELCGMCAVVCPEKSFAPVALRGLASTQWDQHRRLAKTNSLCHDEQMPGPSHDGETKPASSSKNIQAPPTLVQAPPHVKCTHVCLDKLWAAPQTCSVLTLESDWWGCFLRNSIYKCLWINDMLASCKYDIFGITWRAFSVWCSYSALTV